jgi:DNA-binding transcriptional LysR family regulator
LERLDDLVLFKHVVEAGGFAAAARNLGMQRSKLSRRIAELEQRMGVRLLQRNTRRMAMTDAGQRVYHHACAVAQEARAAFDIAAELKGEVRGTLRITCPVSFAGAALMPVIREFCDLNPHVNVAIDASDRMSDLVAARAGKGLRPDAGIPRHDPGDSFLPGLLHSAFGSQRLFRRRVRVCRHWHKPPAFSSTRPPRAELSDAN